MMVLGGEPLQRALLDNIPDMAWVKDRASRYLAVNQAYLRDVDLSEQDVLGRTPAEIWTLQIAQGYLRTDRAVLKSGRQRRYEESRLGADGLVRWFDTIKSPIRDPRGRIVGTMGISREISERKAVEAEVTNSRARIRELSHYLQTVRDEERARISREFHDELGQTLTAMKMDLNWLHARLPAEDKPLHERVHRVIELVNRSVTEIRRIASDLPPLMLDDLGLLPAIRWLTDTMSARGQLAIGLFFDREDVTYQLHVSTAAFRIVQEALTNVARHSQASRVVISFMHKAGELRIEIRDNGCGIPTTAASTGHGLLGMRERALMLGGTLIVGGVPNGGTRVAATLPLS